MITDNDQLDEFGFSLDLNKVYPVEKKKIIRKCGFCRVPGHDIRSCEAYKSSDFDCLFTNSRKCSIRSYNGFICRLFVLQYFFSGVSFCFFCVIRSVSRIFFFSVFSGQLFFNIV